VSAAEVPVAAPGPGVSSWRNPAKRWVGFSVPAPARSRVGKALGTSGVKSGFPGRVCGLRGPSPAPPFQGWRAKPGWRPSRTRRRASTPAPCTRRCRRCCPPTPGPSSSGSCPASTPQVPAAPRGEGGGRGGAASRAPGRNDAVPSWSAAGAGVAVGKMEGRGSGLNKGAGGSGPF